VTFFVGGSFCPNDLTFEVFGESIVGTFPPDSNSKFAPERLRVGRQSGFQEKRAGCGSLISISRKNHKTHKIQLPQGTFGCTPNNWGL